MLHRAEHLVLLLFCSSCIASLPFAQADIDSAFRRIPVKADHRWACGIVFKHEGVVYFSEHAAVPFGATAAVHAWERCLRNLLYSFASRFICFFHHFL